MNRRGFIGRLGLAIAGVILAPAVNLLTEPGSPVMTWAEIHACLDQIQINWLKIKQAMAMSLLERAELTTCTYSTGTKLIDRLP